MGLSVRGFVGNAVNPFFSIGNCIVGVTPLKPTERELLFLILLEIAS